MSDSPVVQSDDTTETESNSQPNDQPEQRADSTSDSSTSTKTSSSNTGAGDTSREAVRSRVRPSLVEKVVAWVEAAGSPTEASTQRDGFLSYKSESHAAGVGIAAGWFYGAEGRAELLSMVYAAAVQGKAFAESGQRLRVFRDVAHEPHYALAGVVVGAALGGSVGRALEFLGADVGSLVDVATALPA